MRSSNVVVVAKPSEHSGLYFRVGHNDHAGLSRLIAGRKLSADGLVLDARRHDRHAALREQADGASIATCLDTQAMELAMPGTTSKGHAVLPWASAQPHGPEDFSPQYIEQFVSAIVARVIDGAYTEVMAPAHYIGEDGGIWLDIDAQLTDALRRQLNAAGQEAVRIVYPLAVHHRVFYRSASQAVVRRHVRELPVDRISLRVHPFGNNSGPLVMRNFIEACWNFRRVGFPLMIERAGFAGLSAFALGAVDIVESGITLGDSFDIGGLQRPRRNGGKTSFSPPERVYVEALGTTVERDVAARLMSTGRGKLHFACKNPSCCPGGFRDMLEDSQRHSALARQREYLAISAVPKRMRAEYFIQNVVTPVCDMLSRAGDQHEPFKKAHRRMLSVKETLHDLQQERQSQRNRDIAQEPVSKERPIAKVIPLPPRDPKGR